MDDRLAIEGGMPVRDTLLPYGRQMVDEADECAVLEALRSDWLTTGPRVGEYEERFAARVGARHAVAFSSGTAALHAAAAAAGLQAGDEMITTPLTFVASANCALYLGARPVFADVQEDTLNIDPAAIESKITPHTRAIVAVDFTGQPADLRDIGEIAARRGIALIEDAAHALGAIYQGRPVGSLATMTVFSTHPVKHVTTGEGGVVTTQDPALAACLRRFRNHGIASDARMRQEKGSWFYEMTTLGYNYRITDVQCALGLSQLPKLDAWLARRRAIAARYNQAFGCSKALTRPAVRPDRVPAWHLYVVRLRRNALQPRIGRSEVFAALRAENIGVNVHYIPVPRHPYYRQLGYSPHDTPIADAAYEDLITLPLFPAMTDADVEDVIAAVRKVTGAYELH